MASAADGGGGGGVQDLNRCIDKIELVDYHQVLEHEGIKFWCYNAGHVLGAAMFMIEIAVSRTNRQVLLCKQKRVDLSTDTRGSFVSNG